MGTKEPVVPGQKVLWSLARLALPFQVYLFR
jgi:hypothetical protein